MQFERRDISPPATQGTHHTGTSKSEGLEDLRRRLLTSLPPPCTASGRLVFGNGSAEAQLAIVGEAPGRQEEEQGRPFVGRAGQLLRQTLERSGIDPSTVWITNVVKCRPTTEVGGQPANRAPTRREAEDWQPWLMEELGVLRPAIILCLGNLAANSLIHKDFRMNDERGTWLSSIVGVPALATFHPAYVLRQHHERQHRERQRYEQGETVRQLFERDLASVKKKLEDI